MACAALGAVASASAAPAATFVETSAVDSPDAVPGNGVCADNVGRCTLRAAVAEANALPGADVVMLPAGAYKLTAGQVAITDAVTITGAGSATCIISGNQIGRVFMIPGSVHVVISPIDAGDARRCLSTDQRGAHRPADGDHNGSAICDIGAYEQQP
jgi:CSLREA domain-containing protein